MVGVVRRHDEVVTTLATSVVLHDASEVLRAAATISLQLGGRSAKILLIITGCT